MSSTPDSSDNPSQPPVKIPAEALSAEALRGVMDDFILREGTDYGAHETGYEAKVQRVRAQIEKGEVVVVFDPNSESVTLMPKVEWLKTSGLESESVTS